MNSDFRTHLYDLRAFRQIAGTGRRYMVNFMEKTGPLIKVPVTRYGKPCRPVYVTTTDELDAMKKTHAKVGHLTRYQFDFEAAEAEFTKRALQED